jgi:ribosome-associated toxin RatA of RatAB toxin-antitoxin module
MFELVDDVDRYPEFLPWCGGARILTRGGDRSTARIDIDYRGVRQSFTTANRSEGGEWLHLELVSGPFRNLEGHWHFRPLAEDASKVELSLEYAFSSAVLEKLVGPVFDHIASTMVDSFVQRAETLHARRVP